MLNPEKVRRYPVGRVNLSAVNLQIALECIHNHVGLENPNYICVTNSRAVAIYSKKWDDYRDIQSNSLLSIPDGMPLAWIAWAQGLKFVERTTGYSLMRELFKEGHSHYFFGDTQETLDELKQHMQNNYSKAEIVGIHSPPFRELTEDEVKQTADDINRLNPDFIWIGLGAPKQERFMVRIMPYLNRGILVGVGAAFRLQIGKYKTPHPILQKMGLEGVFWRIGKVGNMYFIRNYCIMSYFLIVNILRSIYLRIKK